MKIIKILFLSLFLSLLIIPFAKAALITPDKVGDFNKNLDAAAATSNNYDTTTSLEDVISTVVRVILSALGIIFVLLAFLAGNDWVQAAGNEEKVKKSKDTLRNLLIGLALIIIAYALSSGFGGILASLLLTK